MDNINNIHNMKTRAKRKLEDNDEDENEDSIYFKIKKKKKKKKSEINSLEKINLMEEEKKRKVDSIEIESSEIKNILNKKKKNKKRKKVKKKLSKEDEIKKYGGYYNDEDEFIIEDLDDEDIESQYEEYLNSINPWKEIVDDKVLDLEFSSDSENDLDYNENSSSSIEMTEEEIEYWNNINDDEKETIKKLEDELTNYKELKVPDRFKILKLPLNVGYRKIILKKLEYLEMMEPSDNEYFKIDKWLSGILSVPFGKYNTLNISKKNKPNEIFDFLYNVNNVMNKSVYGHVNAKDKILQVVSQWISNPNSSGNIIALQGPPGIGKTSLVKNGIAKALNRPFHMIPLGGTSDSSFLEGHSYTYEGSTYGRIIQILIDSKCMNPVIFFDELDKVSETKHGEEIIGVLTHLTDQTQNSNFNDKYFTGIDFDLSKVLFVFSYNHEEKINPILRDRLIKINLNGFDKNEKLKISKDYIIPELIDNVGLEKDDIVISDKVIDYIISKHSDEKGVRDLKRAFETIFLKINMYKYINNSNNKNKKIELSNSLKDISFPFNLSNENIDVLLKSNLNENDMSISAKMMYL